MAEPSTAKFWPVVPPAVSTCSVPPVKAGITVEPTSLRKKVWPAAMAETGMMSARVGVPKVPSRV